MIAKNKTTLAKKKKISCPNANIYVTFTSNNTRLVATTPEGNVLLWVTAGTVGYKGTKRSTPSSAGDAAFNFIERVKPFGIKECTLIVKGISAQREATLRVFASSGLPVQAVYDYTPLRHGGCRPKGERRV